MSIVDPLQSFGEVWLADFEFRQPPGSRPEPICMVAREFRTGRTIRVWADELARMTRPPFPIGSDSLLVAYYASAELTCFLALDWPMPVRILDLFTEFRCLTNGLAVPCGNGLLGALAYFGLDAMPGAEKNMMRELAQRDGPYTDAEREALLDYCETDVVALARLLPAMLPKIDLPRALLRGRYMAAAARMEWTGVPIDTDTVGRLRDNWTTIKGRLVAEVDRDYRVYVPAGRTINPQSNFGAEVLRTAEDWDVDPYMLAEAVDTVWREEKESRVEHQEALKAARQATGLTAKRISDWEHAGRDHSTWPGLDTKARELAGEYPALGIGTGYADGGYDETDYAGQLWSLLREGASVPKPKHDPHILTRAAELVASAGPDCRADRLSFSTARWAEWLARKGIPWPRLESGMLDLSDETFRQMARQHAEVAPIRELRHTLSQLRLNDLAVGSDGRNRCLLSAFRARTGRNQPSNSRFIFGPSCWLRGLIQPPPGRAVAYVDWEQQEFGIAAALSGDGTMMEAYASGDPYLTFAKQAGAVPLEATKATHPHERDQFKVTSLAVQYGMGARKLAESLGIAEVEGRELLRLHRQTYPRFWRWSEAAVNHAMLRGWLQTVFGWRVHVGPESNPRSLSNFPMQANGAEMLRLACCLATERGITVCAPVHDALLVEGLADEVENVVTNDIENVVTETQAAMAEASRVVLDGFELRTDAKIVTYPDRYVDDRGAKMWQVVMGILTELEDPPTVQKGGPSWDTHLSQKRDVNVPSVGHPPSLMSCKEVF
jgi:hypothetical protein